MNKRRIQGAGAVLTLTAAVVFLPIPAPHAARAQASTPSTLALTVANPVELASTDPVLEWNVNVLQAISTATPSGVLQSRLAAIVETAVYDAVASFSEDAERYAGIDIQPPPGASMDAAAIAAAHSALVNLLPAQRASLDALYASSLSARGLTIADPGVAVGEDAASGILASRAADGSASAQFPYTAPGAGNPGVWVPTPPAFAPASLPGWGNVTPWVMRRGSQFRVPPPPAVDSDVYVRDVEEVRDFGALNSIVRTSDQTEIAKWWPPSAVILWNPIARQVAVARGLSISENARLFALLNVAAADAAIACYESKYAYNVWRPISAIRNADGVSIPADPTWQPFLATPAFPEYPSAHNEISGAMAQILITFFGDTPGVTMVAHSPANPAFDHVWTQFSEGIDEVINARVWEGIHFRNSDEQGMRAGRCVGQFVVRHALRVRGDRPDVNRGEAPDDHHDGLRCDDLGHVARDGRDDDRSR
jgi:vanadium-dependent haloperoxidase-like protein